MSDENETPSGDLVERLARIVGELTRFEHTGSVKVTSRDSYTFTGIDDLADVLRPLFAREQIIIVPQAIDVVHFELDKRERSGRDGPYTTFMYHAVVRVAWLVRAANVEVGDGRMVQAIITTIGEGADTSDKALNKAQSAARKRCYIDALHISTGETDVDAERTGDEHAHAPARQQQSSGGQEMPSDKQIGFARKTMRETQDADVVVWQWLESKGVPPDARDRVIEFLNANKDSWGDAPTPITKRSLSDLIDHLQEQPDDSPSG